MSTKTFPIEDIQLDARCQARATIDNDAVADYAAAYERGDELPPVDVFMVAGKPYLINGFHRLTSQIKIGKTFTETTIVGTGTIDDAIWHATRANAANGLRRTNEDKRRAARLALESKVGADQSSRVIAEWIGVSDFLIREVRESVESQLRESRSSSSREVQALAPEPAPKRIGKDGKARSVTQPKPKREPSKPAPKADAAPTPVAEEREPEQESEPEAHVELDVEVSGLPSFRGALIQLAKDIAALRVRARKVVAETLVHGQSLERQLKDAESTVDAGIPETCPFCLGGKCSRCQSRGWASRTDVAQWTATAKRLGRPIPGSKDAA